MFSRGVLTLIAMALAATLLAYGVVVSNVLAMVWGSFVLAIDITAEIVFARRRRARTRRRLAPPSFDRRNGN